jgi:3-hydroxyisobutyrate dehydrogenase-like beta-hydroxyacid dehydrogenase
MEDVNMSKKSETVGFVGTGLMGHGMAKNLLEVGYDLSVIAHSNRVPVDDLVSRGAVEAASLEALGESASVVFICAPGSPQVEEVVRGLKAGLKPGSVIVDCSTADPNSTVMLAQEMAEAGVDYVDAPLGGTPAQAETGELQAIVGALDSVFERVKPVIDAWAGRIVHIGGVGDGHRMKLLNNFLSLGYAAIYSEALALSAKAGLSAEQFDSIIRGSRMDCGFYQTFMGYTIDGNPEAHKFTLSNAQKDLRYLGAMADAAGVANPIGNAVKNSFSLALNTGGDGAQDYIPMLPEYVGRANGVDLTPKKLRGQK